MEIFLASLTSFSISKLLGKNCGLDCDISDFGLIEYIILLLIFTLAFYLTRKLIKYLKEIN